MYVISPIEKETIIKNKIKTEIESKIKTKVKIYDLIISIGEACSCTQCLRLFKLQDFSYPFDWLWGSTFTKRIDIISSQFENFINKEDLVFSHPEKPISCNAYKNISNGLVFNHDFPQNVAFDIAYKEVRAKYDRRIKRLLEKINNSQKVLFVYMELPTAQNTLGLNNILINSQEKLAKAFPKTKCDILYIKHDAKLPVNQYNYEDISKRVLKVSLYNKSLNPNSDDYVINLENAIKIFHGYFLNKISINLDIYDNIAS